MYHDAWTRRHIPLARHVKGDVFVPRACARRSVPESVYKKACTMNRAE